MDAAPAPTASAPSVRSEFGPLLRAVAKRYFPPVRVSAEAETRLRALNEQGFVIHVMRSTAWVNYLYLAWTLVSRGLPPLRAVVNLRPWLGKPWRKAARRGDHGVRFTYARRVHGSGLIFLRRSLFGSARGRDLEENPFPSLVAMARRADRPVFLVPELFAWSKWSDALKPGLNDYLFGSPEAPGFLHTVLAFWRNHHRAQFRVGEPIDLRRMVSENPGLSDEQLGSRVRSMLYRHLARETRAVFGPPFKHPDRLLEETLRDPSLRREIEAQAQQTRRPPARILAQARRQLKSIAARYHPTVVAMVSPLMDWIFGRLYDRVEVDEAGLDRALAAGRTAPVVFCPTHKSHVDYLVMSWVLWNRGYTLPLVAAGANLSFFPLGPVFRRCGAFFLRRSFKGDPLYAAAFKAYVRKLVREGVHQEFFLEGGRSRTGKLLQAKLGLLTWQVEAVLEGANRDLAFVPAAIDYEKVIESGSYSRELAGGEKRPEDLKALLKAPGVLRSKYGRIQLSFDRPLFLTEVMAERGLRPGAPLPEEAKRALVRSLSHRILYGMTRVSVVTPQALAAGALLANGIGRGAVTAPELGERIGLLRRILTRDGAPFSAALANAPSDPSGLGPLRDTLSAFTRDGLVRIDHQSRTTLYEPVPERRQELAFYKNTLMNRVVPLAVLARAVQGGPARGDALSRVRERALFLSRLFKFEFVFRVGVTFNELFAQALETLTELGQVVRWEDTVLVAPEAHARPQLNFLSEMVRDLLEAYSMAAVTFEGVLQGQISDGKGFLRAALEKGREALLAGSISSGEALSRTTLENALAYFKDRGWLLEQGRRLRVSEGGAVAVNELRATLGALLHAGRGVR